jgi:2-iminobutanoate/2-iminopropanoate deaminase
MKKEIRTDSAPLPIGPYSQGIASRAGELVFTAGQIAIPAGGTALQGEGIEEQARCALENIRGILKEAGCELRDVVKVTVYLQDMDDYPALNLVYERYFANPPYPARSVVEVAGLPKGALVEIEAIAARGVP